MPGGVRSRQPWLYLGADWAASDILGPEREAGSKGSRGRERGRWKVMSKGKGCKWEGRVRGGPELPEKAGVWECVKARGKKKKQQESER